jgi:hypothetical protein
VFRNRRRLYEETLHVRPLRGLQPPATATASRQNDLLIPTPIALFEPAVRRCDADMFAPTLGIGPAIPSGG